LAFPQSMSNLRKASVIAMLHCKRYAILGQPPVKEGLATIIVRDLL